MELEIAVLSRTGGRSVNEDACGFWPGPGICYCVLADGAGGHGGGDVASKLVVQEALNSFRERQGCSAPVIAGAMRAANETLIAQQRTDRKLAEMRATVVVLALDFDHAQASWGHIGDSRLYCFREHEIVAQTRDHSVVQTMVEAGYLQPHELRTSPERSKLLNALGDREGFEPSVEGQPFPLQGGDKFLMCSDGLWEYIEDAELAQTLAEAPSAEAWLRSLESRVLSRGRSGQDNYSAIAVWCKP
ncbi:MAG TPA: PP2C family serine/threonine-protein phosphatase [Burkholderiales bacterium]|nr:PP2C family serine/threonine-protein phosphatase [Burkholderiales bacterium]